jgi:two-component system, chemotaxis family, sensor kinase Cph1
VGGQWGDFNPLRLTAGDRRFDGIAHRPEGALILELEPVATTAPPGTGNYPLRAILVSLQAVRTQRALCDRVVKEIRRLSGFER